MPLGGQERQRGRERQTAQRPELGRRLHDEVAPGAQHAAVERVEGGAAVDLSNRVEAVLERGHHAEVAAAAPQRPEQIRLGLLAAGDQLAVRRHHVGFEQVVDGEAAASRQVAHPAAEREPADAGGRDDPAGTAESERVGGVIDVAPGAPTLDSHATPRRVDADAAQASEVEHHTAVDGAEAGRAVPTAAHRERHLALASEADGRHHVGDVGGPDDRRRTSIVHAVVDLTGLVVARVVGSDQVAAELLFQAAQRTVVHRLGSAGGHRPLQVGHDAPPAPSPAPARIRPIPPIV